MPRRRKNSDTTVRQRGAEEARSRLPELLDDAESGRATLITRHGRPIAALVPIAQYEKGRQLSVLPFKGTGRGMWGKDSARTIRELRDEWQR